MYDHTFSKTRSDIRPHIKWTVSLVIAYGHFNLPQGLMWVYNGLTYLLNHPRGESCLVGFVLPYIYIGKTAPKVLCEALLRSHRQGISALNC